MISRKSILDWKVDYPWQLPEMVEQDLIICRAIVSIFSDPFLAKELAWKGGTALHKLYLKPQARYSEDIDLVQVNPGPIKPIFMRLGEVLSWLPNRSTQQTRYSNKIRYRYLSEVEPQVPMRLKIEINCMEHFCQLGHLHLPFEVKNDWFSGSCEITTFRLPELLCTKFNAVYGRKKVRDLFDMDYALKMTDVDPAVILRCWRTYRALVHEEPVSKKNFIRNMEAKLRDPDYLSDMETFLRPGTTFDPKAAWSNVRNRLVDTIG